MRVVECRTPMAWEGRGFPEGGGNTKDKDAKMVLRLTPDLRHWPVVRRRKRPVRNKEESK